MIVEYIKVRLFLSIQNVFLLKQKSQCEKLWMDSHTFQNGHMLCHVALTFSLYIWLVNPVYKIACFSYLTYFSSLSIRSWILDSRQLRLDQLERAKGLTTLDFSADQLFFLLHNFYVIWKHLYLPDHCSASIHKYSPFFLKSYSAFVPIHTYAPVDKSYSTNDTQLTHNSISKSPFFFCKFHQVAQEPMVASASIGRWHGTATASLIWDLARGEIEP